MSALFHSWPAKLAALLLGAVLGMAGSMEKLSESAAVPPARKAVHPEPSYPRPTGSDDHRVSESSRASTAVFTEAYAAAWESLKDGKLPRAERRDLQRLLLAEWAEIDLESALRAAFAEPPLGSEAPFAPSLNEAWTGAVSRQLDFAWDLIQKHAFGPRTAELRERWIRAKGDADPIGLLSHLDDLPPWWKSNLSRCSRWHAVASALRGAHETNTDPALAPAVLTRLLAMPADQGGRQAMETAKDYLPSQSPATLAHGITTATNPAIREIYLDALVTRLRNHDERVETKLEWWVPAELRVEVAAELKARGDH